MGIKDALARGMNPTRLENHYAPVGQAAGNPQVGIGLTGAEDFHWSYYTSSTLSPPSFQPKSAIGYFQTPPSKPKADLNFLDQMAGFKLSPGERAILGGLLVAALPALALGAIAGCGRDLIPKVPSGGGGNELCGSKKCELPNAVPVCVEESCRISNCLEGFVNRNRMDEDGCECNSVEQICNHPPVLGPIGNQSISEGEELTFRILARDADRDDLTFSASNLPEGALFDPTTQVFRWVPTFAQAGTYPNVHFEVTDGIEKDFEKITVTVNNVNRAPVLEAIGDKVIEGGDVLNFRIHATDPDGDSLTYSATGLPTGADFSVEGEFNWTPGRAQIGNHVVTFKATDGILTASETINIEVRGVREIRESRVTNDPSPSQFPSAVWTGTEYGVSWVDYRDVSEEIYFARISASGEKIGGDVRITNNPSGSVSPSLVWTGTEYGVSWRDERDSNNEIYFARIMGVFRG